MNVLILGDGPEERAWASWFAARPEHHVQAIYPSSTDEDLREVAAVDNLDEALVLAGLELVVVGGPLALRGEALRRVAAEGLAIICIHPPGEDSEAYYQVSLSRAETGAVVVPYLPLRLHPGVTRLRQVLASGELCGFRGVRHECPAGPEDGELARGAFPRMVDVVRAVLGEIEALTASGDPPGEHPDVELLVQLRAGEGRRAEVRTWPGGEEPARLTITGAAGSLALEYDRQLAAPARLIRRTGAGSSGEQISELEAWDPHAAILEILHTAMAAGGAASGSTTPAPSPTLDDGTRAMELSEAVVRSLRRGRTIDLHYESISEESTFKSIMTSTGCMILLASLLILPLALSGPALGLPWTIYFAYLIPPVLVVFAVTQILRYGISKPGKEPRSWRGSGPAAEKDAAEL
jgi:myo-inositol 2-dehydrogenase/D-chiro-inositol 1-dehydrogenase